MTNKRYATLIISQQPIELGNVGEDLSIEHLVQVELELVSNGKGDFTINRSVPEHCRKQTNPLIYGKGKSISVAIIDWFRSLISSMEYLPLREKRESAKESEKDSAVD